MKRSLWVLPGVLALFGMRDAGACGCFTPPDPSVPIVQAGEKILFSIDNGMVTAHIQIQYAGDAKDFGWLLPLPSVPTLELGTDELFAQLYTTTQPKYKLIRNYEGNCSFAPGRNGSPAPSAGGLSGGDSTQDPGSPLVLQDSIGPYDYAVLHADDQQAMLDWLTQNHYFVPAGTDQTISNYIHPGAYFLALKLKSGASAGELQPVVVRYPSDLPMIPIVLTSVAAQPHMGIQVWMLGKGRAIPRNYFHTVVDDALIDWINAGANYNDVIIKAVGEATGRHSFVTEYAGSSSVMKNVLNYPGRFGSTSELAAQPDAYAFVQYLFSHGYGVLAQQQGGPGPGFGGYTLTSQLTAILGQYIPEPAGLVTKQVSPSQFYQGMSYYLSDQYKAQNPGDFVGWPGINYQPTAMAMAIDQRVVQPTLEAGALFDAQPTLTRLYTTLSPEDMNKDPVFSYNGSLPNVGNVHTATLTYHCGMIIGSTSAQTTSSTLVTEQGWHIEYPNGPPNSTQFTPPAPGLPGSLRIEILREEGAPEVVVDNSGMISGALNQGGCGVAVGGRLEGSIGIATMLLTLCGLVLVGRRRVRR